MRRLKKFITALFLIVCLAPYNPANATVCDGFSANRYRTFPMESKSIVEEDNYIWFGTVSGLKLYDKKLQQWFSFLNGNDSLCKHWVLGLVPFFKSSHLPIGFG